MQRLCFPSSIKLGLLRNRLPSCYRFCLIFCSMSVSTAIIPPPPARSWIQIKDQEDGVCSKDKPRLTVLSYNILSDLHVKPGRYPYCPPDALKWKDRKSNVLKEILHYEPDIVTLQEVDADSMDDLKAGLGGYEGIFETRSSKEELSDPELAKKLDGCAIFWKKARLIEKAPNNVTYLHKEAEKLSHIHGMVERVVPHKNIAMYKTLYLKYGRNQEIPVVVCNTHVHWNPEFADVKIIQTMLLIRALKKVIYDCCSNVTTLPIILAGDFNSLPESGVREYFRKMSLDYGHKELLKFEGRASLHFINEYSGSMESDIPIDRKITLHSETEKHLPWTNYTDEFEGVIDYIFSSESLCWNRILGPVPEEWIKKYNVTGFPNKYFPSDHIPLVTEFIVDAP